MALGQQPGPSKRDGSLLTFLGSPTANATQALAQATTTQPLTKKCHKSSPSQPTAKPAAIPQPPPATGPVPTPKDPVSRFNKIYYDLVFNIKARGEVDAMSLQRLYLTEFITSICQVDTTAVLLPYKSFFALNEEVLHDPAKLGRSYTAISKYFQGFHSQRITDKMHVSVLVAYDSSQEDFYQSLRPALANLGHNVYTRSIQTPFISKIGWLFHSHEHTDLRHLTELLEDILHRLNPSGPPLLLASSSRTSGMAPKPLRLSLHRLQEPPLPPPCHTQSAKLCGLSMLR